MASGSASDFAVSLTLQGEHTSSAAVVVTAPGGTRTVMQAINGLRDDRGVASGALTIDANGTSYAGSGVFVITTLNAKGVRVNNPGAATTKGNFTLACVHGYATIPTTTQHAP